MPIRTTCDDCGTTYDVPDALAGRSVQCRKCGAVFAVPNVSILATDPAFRIRGRTPAADPPANDPPANDPPANDPPANDPEAGPTAEDSGVYFTPPDEAAADDLSALAAAGGGPNLARLDVRPKWRQAFDAAGGGVRGGWAAAARFGVTPMVAVVGLVAVVACLAGLSWPGNSFAVGLALVLASLLYFVVGVLVSSAMSAGQDIRDGHGRVMAGNVLIAGVSVTLAALTGVRVFGWVPLRRTRQSDAARWAARRRRSHVLRQTGTLLAGGVACLAWSAWLSNPMGGLRTPTPPQAYVAPPRPYALPTPGPAFAPTAPDPDDLPRPAPVRPPRATPPLVPSVADRSRAERPRADPAASATTAGLRVLSRALADYAAANHGQYPPTLDAVPQTPEVTAARSATDVGYRPFAVAAGDRGLLLFDAAELAAHGSAPAVTVDGTPTTARRNTVDDAAP